ncbi:Pal1 cell morphology protein-domain-containing protein [Cercophora scortea]|uniref:Pal1 cell morphology protein-domain-containing protein n=1 Tax=Cercophora scortea TaxID=314031 RepID=A0AAE0J3X2_9PEZI|nr:Pal1 cell morphology protein-domain-containing protein [Cercophora scortea]
MSTAENRSSPTAEDLFGSLSIDDNRSGQPGPSRPDASRQPPVNRRAPPPPVPGRENVPPPYQRAPPPYHRPSHSQEEALRARRVPGKGESSGPFEPSRSPQRRSDNRRPRRNSESSVLDVEKPLTEEEKRIREARRRDRERRYRDAKDKKAPSRKLDIIDQLDATSIYGTGMFHHDGPFDALNPHRNRHGSRRAPMQAFPKDSLNNILGGSGPLNARPDHAALMGQHDDEAFKEWSSSAKDRTGGVDSVGTRKGETPVFDPLARGNILHGDESLGLGTSTFLEGAPAARSAIQKREEERVADTDGLQRKKSLAQRIRNINRGPRDPQPSGRMTNPDGAYMSRRSPSDGGIATSASMQPSSLERNPFFSEFEPGKKGEESISVRRTDANNGKSSPTSPRGGYGLERRTTADATTSLDDAQSKPTGILGRMKSLKGGRRTRPPNGGENGPVAAPGTAV